mmetsp:Transcript_8925/g.19834  ORF Transcript_8925/g.19834 Transcript_8925/m.19834 type:complete len:211 (+) Transcript_8925:550-1182(+)
MVKRQWQEQVQVEEGWLIKPHKREARSDCWSPTCLAAAPELHLQLYSQGNLGNQLESLRRLPLRSQSPRQTPSRWQGIPEVMQSSTVTLTLYTIEVDSDLGPCQNLHQVQPHQKHQECRKQRKRLRPPQQSKQQQQLLKQPWQMNPPPPQLHRVQQGKKRMAQHRNHLLHQHPQHHRLQHQQHHHRHRHLHPQQLQKHQHQHQHQHPHQQ